MKRLSGAASARDISSIGWGDEAASQTAASTSSIECNAGVIIFLSLENTRGVEGMTRVAVSGVVILNMNPAGRGISFGKSCE